MQEKTNEFKTLELPKNENFDYKGMRYVIRHTYKNSGENLINILKNQLLKNLAAVDSTPFSCYNEKVNIFGD